MVLATIRARIQIFDFSNGQQIVCGARRTPKDVRSRLVYDRARFVEQLG